MKKKVVVILVVVAVIAGTVIGAVAQPYRIFRMNERYEKYDWLFFSLVIVGLVLAFNGVVRLCARKGTGPWKEGGVSLLAGVIIVGVSAFMLWSFFLKFGEHPEQLGWMFMDKWGWALTVGLVLLFNGVVQLCVRKQSDLWKEGGASLLAGAIIAGVSVFGLRVNGGIVLGFFTAGLVLFFNGVVQLSVRKGTGPWKEGGASLLAGVIIAGMPVFGSSLVWRDWGESISPRIADFSWVLEWRFEINRWTGCWLLIAGLVLAFNGVVQLCVDKKTGLWKEGGVSLLAGIIVTGVTIGLPFWLRMVFGPPPG